MKTSIRKAQLPLFSIVAVLCFMQHTANADTITFNPLELPETGYPSIAKQTQSTRAKKPKLFHCLPKV